MTLSDRAAELRDAEKDDSPRVGNQSAEVGDMPNWSYRVRSGSSA